MTAVGVSVAVLTVGAVLAFVVSGSTSGGATIGVILMIVGATLLLISMLFRVNWSPMPTSPDADERRPGDRP
ncbi:MAG: hypothetical protein ACRDG3_01915 [Tepidiformaceae bacterium]